MWRMLRDLASLVEVEQLQAVFHALERQERRGP